MISVEELLKNLVSVPSISNDETKLAEYIWNLLSQLGFELKKIPINDNRFNIIAQIGRPKIYFSAHMDTVAPYIDLKEDEKYFYGRGS